MFTKKLSAAPYPHEKTTLDSSHDWLPARLGARMVGVANAVELFGGGIYVEGRHENAPPTNPNEPFQWAGSDGGPTRRMDRWSRRLLASSGGHSEKGRDPTGVPEKNSPGYLSVLQPVQECRERLAAVDRIEENPLFAC